MGTNKAILWCALMAQDEAATIRLATCLHFQVTVVQWQENYSNSLKSYFNSHYDVLSQAFGFLFIFFSITFMIDFISIAHLKSYCGKLKTKTQWLKKYENTKIAENSYTD